MVAAIGRNWPISTSDCRKCLPRNSNRAKPLEAKIARSAQAPAQAETRKLAAHGDRRRRIKPAMHVKHQIDIRPDRIAHGCDDIDRLAALPAVHFKVGDIEGIPFQGAGTHGDRLAGLLGILLRCHRAEEPEIGVTLDPIAISAAKQFEDRNAERLARDIEKGRLDRAEGGAEDRTRGHSQLLFDIPVF